MDYKGWFRTGDNKRCEPLTMKDLRSHYILQVAALPNVRHVHARRVFEEVFEENGLPKIIRSDNGPPFASRGAAGLSRLSVWWIELGIKPEFTAPGHPEQNGSHERMHRTLKHEACEPPQRNLQAQQRKFDEWRQIFNEQRPHESLQMDRPVQHYKPSTRRYCHAIEEPNYNDDDLVRRVRSNGEIKWKGRKRYFGEALVGCLVALRRFDEGIYQAYLRDTYLGDLHDEDPGGLRPTVSAARVRRKKTDDSRK